MSNEQFDVVVIGGGPGGYVAAIRAAQLGMKVALVEKSELGGICLNWGCIPTKALLRSADIVRLIRHAADFGVRADVQGIDLDSVIGRSRKVAGQLQRGVTHLMKKNGVSVHKGHARLKGQGVVEVTGKDGVTSLIASNIILATGARPRQLPGLQPDGDTVWTYFEALRPSRLPTRLLIVGAGAIGIEFASFYETLGVEVTVVEMAERILPVEDEEVSAYVADALTRQGIRLRTGCRVRSKARTDDLWHVEFDGPDATAIDVDVILVAAGVVGNVEELGLENTKVRVDRNHIVAGDFGVTDEPGVFAIGDVAGAPCLAHKASHEGVACVEKIAGLDAHALDVNSVPACTYSHPQVASVGQTESQAKSSGRAVRIGKFPFSANGKAIAMGSTDGFVKVVFDSESGELLGAHMVGDEVTEMIQGYVVARQLETTEAELMASIVPHPTQSEAMHEAVLAAYDRALHI
ncbi:dihydrolipoamide dehydrogenase [Paraburkholderia sp. BL27I4N3]|uniref:dihydrolipoyl dehydrogenase n=1 Tax=Paraburkholderia sp. BL27I4N3 TaxID=1938805 RepID=UPI000E24C9BC|nr:dihydrolipoyl dehydrogenase [Paraburkholderia sp. BL27I4N3]REE07109.1 dihydrolipoamide dehydrogenase [Paraburkholderia sp. BL27I4N3]